MQNNRFGVAFSLILLGSLLAAYVQTDGGDVVVHDVRFVGSANNALSAHLYVPDTATVANPAPGVLAIHGYINSRETQSGFAIELARRGYVVLALDQTGHGYSDPPAFAGGFGGPDGLRYLRSLPFVDTGRIGLEGHSMGGWAVQMAAAAHPDDYHAMVLEGSSTGTFGAPAGTATTPRNLLVVFSLFDEFSALMWGAPVPSEIVQTEKLKTLFGTLDDVEEGRLYGSVVSGSARLLAMPPVTHPGDHLSTAAIGAAVDWFERTLGPAAQGTGGETGGQVWYWKELGTLVAMLGLAALIFPLVDMLLGFAWFKPVRTTSAKGTSASPRQTLVNGLVTMLLPVFTFFPLQDSRVSEFLFPANPVFPQQITNGILLWAWGTGLVTLVLLLATLRGAKLGLTDIGLTASARVAGRAAVLAVMACGCLYLVVIAADYFLHTDFRFWVVALKHLSSHQAVMFVLYLPFFAAFFLVLSLSLHAGGKGSVTLPRAMWVNASVLSAGFVVLLVVQYLPLFMGGTLTISSQPLLTIIAFQFVPLLFLVGLVSTFCYYRTSNVYTGAFINGVFLTWYMVAGTATQAVPFWY